MYHNGTMHNDACPAPPAFKVTHMPAQSLAEQLQNFSKSQLKHQQTSITYQSGKKIIVDGEKIIEEGASHTGYVVDTQINCVTKCCQACSWVLIVLLPIRHGTLLLTHALSNR
jgi:chemotaxis response regulator CheB